MRRQTIRLFAAGALPVLLLAGCGSDKASSASSSGSSSSTPTAAKTVPADQVSPMSAISVSTKDPKKPSITLAKKPFYANKTTVKVTKEGTGAVIGDKDLVTLDYDVVNGKDGKEVLNTFSASPVALMMNDPAQFAGMVTALKGKKVGTEMTVAMPPGEAFGAAGNSQLGVSGDDTLIFFMRVDKASTPLGSASGTNVAPKAGLPTVTVPAGTGTQASITMPKTNGKVATAPTKLASQDLITGKGEKVAAGKTILASYTGAIWASGTVFDATAKHKATPALLPLVKGGTIDGFYSGLIGKTVGSRVLLVIPPAQGYGTAGKPEAGIKGTDTLVFVVDILGVS